MRRRLKCPTFSATRIAPMTIEVTKPKRGSPQPPAAKGMARLLELNCGAIHCSCALPEGPMPGTAVKPTGKKAKSSKLGEKKPTPEEQMRRFIEAAREAGASGTSEERFNRAINF